MTYFPYIFVVLLGGGKLSKSVEWEDPKIHPMLSEWITRGKDNHHFCCKVCNNGSLKLGVMGVAAPNESYETQ